MTLFEDYTIELSNIGNVTRIHQALQGRPHDETAAHPPPAHAASGGRRETHRNPARHYWPEPTVSSPSTQRKPAAARPALLITHPAGRHNASLVEGRPSPASPRPVSCLPNCRSRRKQRPRDPTAARTSVSLRPGNRLLTAAVEFHTCFPAAPKLLKRNHSADQAGVAVEEKRTTVEQSVTAGTCESVPFPLHFSHKPAPSTIQPPDHDNR